MNLTNVLNITSLAKPLVCAALLLGTLLTGIWLSNTGKPYHTSIFTIHKLIALATIIFTTVTIRRLYLDVDPRTMVHFSIIAITGLLIGALFVSGALLSINIPLPGIVIRVHQVAPLLVLVSAAATIYALVNIQRLP